MSKYVFFVKGPWICPCPGTRRVILAEHNYDVCMTEHVGSRQLEIHEHAESIFLF